MDELIKWRSQVFCVRVIVWRFFQKFYIIPTFNNGSALENCYDFLWMLFSFSGHSDISLVEMGGDAVKDEDKTVLLEGGALQSGSPRPRSKTASPSIIRFVIHAALVFLGSIMVLYFVILTLLKLALTQLVFSLFLQIPFDG